MKFRKYKSNEFKKWCKTHMIKDNFGLWDFVKNQKVNMAIVTDEFGDESTLTIKVKL